MTAQAPAVPAGTPLFECVVNVSEGRRVAVVHELAQAVTRAALLGVHSDPDHDRSVLTLAGRAGPLVDAVLQLARVAVERIDMRSHAGLHPHLGAVDVVPFVPLDRNAEPGDGMEAAVESALACADRLWADLGVPSFLYEAAARAPDRVSLPRIRAGAFTSLQPDVGGPGPHRTAGAAVVGARGLLVAYNINLRAGDDRAARRIASRVRERDGGLPHVRAIGLFLATPGVAQVSMNLTRPAETTMADAFDAVAAAARHEGIEVLGAELVGLAPVAALGGRDAAGLGLSSPPAMLETEIDRYFGPRSP